MAHMILCIRDTTQKLSEGATTDTNCTAWSPSLVQPKLLHILDMYALERKPFGVLLSKTGKLYFFARHF